VAKVVRGEAVVLLIIAGGRLPEFVDVKRTGAIATGRVPRYPPCPYPDRLLSGKAGYHARVVPL